MGKGIIKSGGDDGLYNVELTLHRERIDATIAIIDAQIKALTTKIDGMEEGNAKDLEKLRRASYQKRKDYLQDNMPEDPTVSAWCGDLTEDLSGNVGTIEIPGERGIVQIQPGYGSNAAYNTERDGQLQPAIANTPAGTFYNLAMLPGWQKWMPTYRHGAISNIDTDNDTCDVKLDVVESSQQGLVVIPFDRNLLNVPVEYMSCNADAFEDGDWVLVKLEGQEWSGAKVIGFKDNPGLCCIFKEHWGDTLCTNNDGWQFSDQPLCTLSPFASLANGILSVSALDNNAHLSKRYDFVQTPTTFVPKEIKIKITANTSAPEIYSVWVGLGLETYLTGWHFFVFAQDNLAPDPIYYYVGGGELVIDISDYYVIPDNDNLQQLDVRCYGEGGTASYDIDYIEIKGDCVPY